MGRKTALAVREAKYFAAGYGEDAKFWIRDNNPKRAGHLARLAARWALRAIRLETMRDGEKEN